jgi:SpoVK/Ycf46/Vps4 family AAA+-type ATPase
MAEWDGINPLNSRVLILGATNRPFDLDDAILRRMPRRILVDLPSEEDRLVILNLLLADEMLDPSVDLPALAKRTNLYSGSDLKNVCVSAALAAVTEEQAAADILSPTHPNGGQDAVSVDPSTTESFTNAEPQRRQLNARHFEKALTEVTASISESMETIELLRKFDREYGNAKEKKRKLMGFGTMAEEAVANVRIVHP